MCKGVVWMPGNGTSNCCGGGGSAASYLEYTYAGGTLDDPIIPGVRILVNMRQHEAAASANSVPQTSPCSESSCALEMRDSDLLAKSLQ